MAYDLKNTRILIVDDMMAMCQLTQSVLKLFGFEKVYLAQNGQEAFEKVCQHDPDLIITDWIMEPMDGLEFTRMVRRNVMTPNPYVPILMMTGFSSRLRVESARDHGVTEFLVKPFTARDLYARVVQIIEKPRQFVEVGEFFGPDRRRKRPKDYQGPRRRVVDEDKDLPPVTKTEAEEKQEKEAANILKKLREEAKGVSS